MTEISGGHLVVRALKAEAEGTLWMSTTAVSTRASAS